MIQQTFARPRWRAIFVIACTCAASARPMHAQLRASWDANAAITQFETVKLTAASSSAAATPSKATIDSRWLDQRAMGGALRYSHPFLQLNADAVIRDGDVSGWATGGVFALLASPAWKKFRVSVSYDGRHVPNDGYKSFEGDTLSLALRAPQEKRGSTWQSNASASISYARNATGLWLRANRHQGAGTSDSLADWSLASGATQQLRSLVVGISLGARNRHTSVQWHDGPRVGTKDSIVQNLTIPGKLDTLRIPVVILGDSGFTAAWQRWTEASGNVGWTRGRFALDASVSARPALAGYPAAMWGEASAVAAATSRVAFVATTRTTPRLPGVAYSKQRAVTFGLRVAPPAFWRPVASTPIRSTSRSFRVQPTGSGQYVFTLNVPNARSVELAGDFTSWEAIKLRQIDATRWEILLTVAPGSHRCNVRIDGADWVPPPGIPSISDEFNGRVGLFVAE